MLVILTAYYNCDDPCHRIFELQNLFKNNHPQELDILTETQSCNFLGDDPRLEWKVDEHK